MPLATNAWYIGLVMRDANDKCNKAIARYKYVTPIYSYNFMYKLACEDSWTYGSGHGNAGWASGRLRIKRTGSTVYAYFWNGSSRTQMNGSGISVTSNDVQFELYADNGGSNPTIRWRADDFTIDDGCDNIGSYSSVSSVSSISSESISE